MLHKTNYRLKDGDEVVLLANARVDGYWYDALYAPFGCWDSHYILKGSKGVVVKARTPSVVSEHGKTEYFANIDVPNAGTVSRVRLHHDQIMRAR